MSSTFAVGGLASGLDTKAIVDQLMAIERAPLTKIQTQQSKHNTRVSAISTLKTAMAALQSAAKSLADRARINAKAATTDTPSTSPTVLTATAGADAINGSFRVTVSQLATATRVASSGPMGAVIDAGATLANAGFRIAPTMGTFRVNGQAITVDSTTTVNALIGAVNSSGAGVTASLVADADGRPSNRLQVVSGPGQPLQLGSLGDTSNALKLLNVADATVTGYTASSTNSGISAAAGALSTSVTINGVTTAINQGDAGFSSAQNADAIAQAINANTSNTVTATAQPDGTITLAQKTVGTQNAIAITATGTGTGLAAGTTQNGTDRMVSTMSLGVTNIGAALTDARLATPIAGLDGSGNGSFKINDVAIAYKATDSITSIVNRINASSAGVTAFYDPIQDRLRLTGGQTGARSMTLEDTQGNFLAATGVLAAPQQLGQNAVFSIDGVNGGAALTSSTNTITGYVPGVALDLKSASASPVTVTVSQNPQATTDSLKTFVNAYNTMLQKIEDLTKYDATTKKASTLTGDLGAREMQRQLRQIVSTAAVGANGTYRNLASIGLSFGVVGSAVGSTNRLSLDEGKLAKALADNPQSVEAVLTGFAATLGAPTTTNLAAVSGTPTVHESGTYHVTVTDAGTGAVEAKFVTTDNRTLWTGTGTMAAGQDNYGVIPGLKITAQPTLTNGATDTFTVSVTNRGVGVRFSDYVENLLDAEGYFAKRKSGDDKITGDFTRRIADMQDRLERRQAALEKKYATLETTLSRLQSQSAALSSQIAKMNASTPQAS